MDLALVQQNRSIDRLNRHRLASFLPTELNTKLRHNKHLEPNKPQTQAPRQNKTLNSSSRSSSSTPITTSCNPTRKSNAKQTLSRSLQTHKPPCDRSRRQCNKYTLFSNTNSSQIQTLLHAASTHKQIPSEGNPFSLHAPVPPSSSKQASNPPHHP